MDEIEEIESYTSVKISIEGIKKRLEKSLNLDDIADVGYLLSHIKELEEGIEELLKLGVSVKQLPWSTVDRAIIKLRKLVEKE
jgi:hypothetical protein